MNANTDTERVTTVPHGVGDAGGVESLKWCVAMINNYTKR